MGQECAHEDRLAQVGPPNTSDKWGRGNETQREPTKELLPRRELFIDQGDFCLFARHGRPGAGFRKRAALPPASRFAPRRGGKEGFISHAECS